MCNASDFSSIGFGFASRRIQSDTQHVLAVPPSRWLAQDCGATSQCTANAVRCGRPASPFFTHARASGDRCMGVGWRALTSPGRGWRRCQSGIRSGHGLKSVIDMPMSFAAGDGVIIFNTMRCMAKTPAAAIASAPHLFPLSPHT